MGDSAPLTRFSVTGAIIWLARLRVIIHPVFAVLMSQVTSVVVGRYGDTKEYRGTNHARATADLANWALFGFTALSSIGVGLGKWSWEGQASLFEQLNALWFNLLIIPTLAGVGALIFARRPANRIGVLLLIPALMLAIITLTQPYLAQFTTEPPEAIPLLLFLVWLNGWGWIWLIFPLLLIIQLFPSGRPLSPRWRIVAYATIGWAGLFVLALTLSRVYNTIEPPLIELVNPYGMLEFQQLELLIEVVWIPGLLLLTGLSLVALGLRFRRADQVERDQIKWLLSAWVLFAGVYIGGGLLGVGGEAGLGGQIFSFFFNLTVLALPLAIGVAILRYRVFDIDIIIRRTLVYGALTISLGAVYLTGVVILQALFVRLTGAESTLAVVVSTLAIAALFQPLRRQVQAIIDRRFFRRKYDAQQVLEQFARRAQQESDLDAISADLVRTVQETLEPEGLRLWLVRRRSPSASRDN